MLGAVAASRPAAADKVAPAEAARGGRQGGALPGPALHRPERRLRLGQRQRSFQLPASQRRPSRVAFGLQAGSTRSRNTVIGFGLLLDWTKSGTRLPEARPLHLDLAWSAPPPLVSAPNPFIAGGGAGVPNTLTARPPTPAPTPPPAHRGGPPGVGGGRPGAPPCPFSSPFFIKPLLGFSHSYPHTPPPPPPAPPTYNHRPLNLVMGAAPNSPR